MKRLALTLAALSSAPLAHADGGDGVSGQRAAVEAAVGESRFGEAVARCSDRPKAELDRALRELCAQAAVALGDRLASSGQMSLARSRWEQALDWNPALADSPDFMERLTLPVWGVSEDDTALTDTAPARVGEGQASPRTAGEAPLGDGANAGETPGDSAKTVRARPVQEAWRAARGDVAIGLGTGWYDGLLGATFTLVLGGRFEAVTSVGLVYPTFDLRLRFHAEDGPLTPTLGLGFFIPFEAATRAGDALLDPLEALYDLGDAFHVDLGVTWFLDWGLAVSSMVSLVTTMDQDHPDAVAFHPQWTTHIGLHF